MSNDPKHKHGPHCGLHTVRFTLEPEYVRVEVGCIAPAGSECNAACTARCDAWGEGYLDECPHPRTDPHECNVLAWLQADDPMCCFHAPGDAEVLATSGKICVTWEGDYFSWFPKRSRCPADDA